MSGNRGSGKGGNRRWADDVDVCGRRIWLKNPRNRAIRAACCKLRRAARNLVVRVYYDEVRFTCATGKGCKS